MRLSQYILPTQKEDPSDAVVSSHRLMIRAGLVRKEGAGMYAYLPAGLRALRKVSAIVKNEMDKAGAMECLMPEMTTADLWKESGRWETMGPEMFRIKDRNGLEYAMGPTHEEAFTALVRSVVSSYKDLPVNVYQINTKFRDEIRPRFGVIRSKEFIMKDAYSFDVTEQGLDASYDKMAVAYRNIFDRCGIETISVQADSGNMGGAASEEFMVASEVGEETLLICEACGYRANQEKAESKRVNEKTGSTGELEEVHTPAVKSIDELVAFFKCEAKLFLKTLVYVADGEPVVAVISGDRELNENKLKNFLGATELDLADDATVIKVTGAAVGFAGPVKSTAARIVYDLDIKNMSGAITGANKVDYHIKGVEPGRDFEIKEETDLIEITQGDLCPDCGKPMIARKGIEVGHIFKLGKKYTESMNLTVLDQNGKAVHPLMGCYGVGVTRTLAAIIEQHHDDRGLVWPAAIAPFDVHLVGIGKSDEEKASIDQIYEFLRESGLDVLFDDRKSSPGFKFADADLIGLPVRITCGKSYFNNGELEIKVRKSGEQVNVGKDAIIEKVKEILKAL